MTEAHIVINGTTLTEAQSMTLRVAMFNFLADMRNSGLGNDDVGKSIAKGYIDRSSEIIAMIGTTDTEAK